MLQTLFLLLATAVGWRPSLLADTNLAVGTVSLRFGTVCCLLVPDGYQMGNCGQWFFCVPVPKITAYRVSPVSWLLNGTSKQHSEKPQHLFLTPNDLKKMLQTYFLLARSYYASAGKIQPCRCSKPSNSLLTNGSSRSYHLHSESQHRIWSIINTFLFCGVASQCESWDISMHFSNSTCSTEVEEWESKKVKVPLKGSWDTQGPNVKCGGKARSKKVMEEISICSNLWSVFQNVDLVVNL